MKKLLKNRYVHLALAFVIGGAAATFLLPEKIVIKKEKEIQYVDRVVEKEVIKYVDRIVEKEKVIKVSEKKIWRKETFPDGHIIEEEIYESNSEQIARVAEQEKQKYIELLSEKEKQYQEKIASLEIHLNPKRFQVYGGVGPDLTDFKNVTYLAGMNATLWGPFVIGGQVSSNYGFNVKRNVGISVTFGVRF